MDLTKCRDNIIGNNWNKGISGGERKRLCIAIELISEPKILFLDEPTSGLDSKSSYDLIFILKQLANEGCMIICTIHQPSSEIFEMFDNLCLMAQGRMAYIGSSKEAENFFAR